MFARAKRMVTALLLAAVVVFPALAWPDRPVRLVVGFQAGGSSDVIARLLAERLRSQLGGTTIIVENKPGAAGSIAADAALAVHDAHSLLMFSDSFVTASLVNKSVRFRPLRDFKMVSVVCEGPLVLLAGPTAPFRDFKEFVSYAKANPGKVNYASAGIGGQQHLTGEYLSAALKLEMTHVPTRGGGQATNDLVGGQIETAILGLGPTLAHIRAGKLKALAVSTESRVPQLPDVPTLTELGVPDFAVTQWFGSWHRATCRTPSSTSFRKRSALRWPEKRSADASRRLDLPHRPQRLTNSPKRCAPTEPAGSGSLMSAD
jgi:tripartite-type tricarboxylate transporter receptor subunit TctC